MLGLDTSPRSEYPYGVVCKNPILAKPFYADLQRSLPHWILRAGEAEPNIQPYHYELPCSIHCFLCRWRPKPSGSTALFIWATGKQKKMASRAEKDKSRWSPWRQYGRAQQWIKATIVHTAISMRWIRATTHSLFPTGFFCYEHTYIKDATSAATTPSTNKDSKGTLSARGRALD